MFASNWRIQTPACQKHPGYNTRTADHTACNTPQQPRGRRHVLNRSLSCAVRRWCAWPTGSPAALQPPCGATTHVPPMRGQVYSQYSIAPLNPQPPCRVEYSQRTACPQRRGRCGSAVQSAPEWRGNKTKAQTRAAVAGGAGLLAVATGCDWCNMQPGMLRACGSAAVYAQELKHAFSQA